MSERVLPFLRTVLLCHRIETDEFERPDRLVHPIHTIDIPQSLFGQPLSEVHLYAQLEDAVGTFEFSVRVEDENRDHVPQPNLSAVEHTFKGDGLDRIIPWEVSLRLDGLVFPAPGVYHLIVRADTQSLHQRDMAARAPMLRVLVERAV